jgi:hypothetical protein
MKGEMMVVLIVAIVMIARTIRTRNGDLDRSGGMRRFRGTTSAPVDDDAENRRLREEVRALRDRIAVLERIATDSSTHLDREIEALRDRPVGRDHP